MTKHIRTSVPVEYISGCYPQHALTCRRPQDDSSGSQGLTLSPTLLFMKALTQLTAASK